MNIIFIDKSPDLYFDFPMHNHGCWEIIVNLVGSGIALIDGQDYPFREGTIFCIPPGTAHKKTSKDGFIDGCIFIHDFVPIGSDKIALFEDDSGNTFTKLLMMAFDVQLKDEPNAKAIINALGDAMYELLVGWSSSQNKRNTPVETFKRILLENVTNCSFDLSSVLKETGYSSSYFRKLFKGSTGYSPVGYMNHLRIEYSKKQLQQYNNVRTIKEIALCSGFSDPYYFSRLFKQCVGVSPQYYAKNSGIDIRQIGAIGPVQG